MCDRAGFINCDIWGQITLLLGDCPVHGGVFGSIPGLYSLEDSCVFPAVTSADVFRYYQMSPERQYHLWLKKLRQRMPGGCGGCYSFGWVGLEKPLVKW